MAESVVAGAVVAGAAALAAAAAVHEAVLAARGRIDAAQIVIADAAMNGNRDAVRSLLQHRLRSRPAATRRKTPRVCFTRRRSRRYRTALRPPRAGSGRLPLRNADES